MAGGWLWYIGAILLAAGLFNLGNGVLSIVTGTVTAAPSSGMQGVIMGLICLAIGPLVLAFPILRWRQSLEIFEGGLVWKRLVLGDKSIPASSLRSVTHITHRGRGGSHVELAILLNDGTEVGIAGLDRADQAANLIAQLASGGGAPAAGGFGPPGGPPAGGGWRPPGGL